MVDWDECMSDARDELGYAEDEYIEEQTIDHCYNINIGGDPSAGSPTDTL